MNRCHEFQTLLNDHVDGRLDPVTRASVEEHLATCENCRREAATLGEILAAARRLPPEVSPPRDLWPDIVGRLPGRHETARAGAGVVGSGSTDRLRAQFRRRRLAYLPQAGLLVAAGIAAMMLMTDSPGPRRGVPKSAPQDFEHLDATYEEVRAELEQTLHRRCTRLPGNTCDELKGTVKVLDESAAAVSRAMREGGGTPHDTLLLTSNYQLTIGRARGLVSRLSRL